MVATRASGHRNAARGMDSSWLHHSLGVTAPSPNAWCGTEAHSACIASMCMHSVLSWIRALCVVQVLHRGGGGRTCAATLT